MKSIYIKIINAVTAGALVLLGAMTGGFPSPESLFAAFVASGIVALTQFRDSLKPETAKQKVVRKYCEDPKVFNFLAI